MVGLCRLCAYEKSDCKGSKDLEKCRCEYYKLATKRLDEEMAQIRFDI